MSRVDVKAFGAVGDGVADDKSAIQQALNFAIESGQSVCFPPGRYRITAYVNITGARNMSIAGEGATIVYASDTAVPTDTIATLATQAASGLFLRYCTDIVIDGLCFEGGDRGDIETLNRGSGVYLRHCTGVTLRQCSQRAGHSLIQGDAVADTNGVGSMLSAGPVVTWNNSQARFTPGHVGHKVTFAGCANAANNGVFVITSVVSPSQATFSNAAGQAEASAFKWTLDDGDKDTRIEGGRSDGVHGSCTTGSHSIYRGHHFEWPTNADVCGIGDAFTVSGQTVTLTDNGGQGGGRFLPRHHGKFIVIRGATAAANNGAFQVSYISPTQISWTNASGVAEPFHGDWWILGGDKTGRGATLSQAGAVQTITVPTAVFAAADLGKMIRLTGSAEPGNNTGAIIASVTSPTTVVAHQPAGVSEAFTGVWTINAYDNGQDAAGNTYGSSHAIYIFAGRQNIIVDGCTFIGNRTCCVKISGTNGPVRNVIVTNCFAQECASFVIAGADDANEHTGIAVENNRLIDCSVQRVGWDAGGCISFLGSRNVRATNNQLHWTRNSILSFQSHGQGAVEGISAGRYVDGRSQPIEDVLVNGNTFTSDPSAATAGSIIHTAISVADVGIRAKYATAGSLTFAAPSVTLRDDDALFTQADVGCQIWRLTPAGQVEGPFAIAEVSSNKQLTYLNPAGASGPVGTYRIQGSDAGGACIVAGNRILSVGTVGVNCAHCVGPEVTGNVFAGLISNIRFNGDVSPRAVNNRSIGVDTQLATIILSPGTSWPFVDDNIITNGAVGASSGRDMGISVVGSQRVDYPLLGKRGRARPADGREEVVLAFGSQLVDGDTITVTAVGSVQYTFKAVSPSSASKQFNSFDKDDAAHVGLVGLINAQAGVECADYGAGFISGNVPTTHLRIRRKVPTAGTDGTLQVATAALNPTALVTPYNQATGKPKCLGRGSASAGASQADRTVIWSLVCAWTGGVIIWADNAAAQTLLQAYGWRPLKDPNDAGACEIVAHGPSAPGPEFRWVIV